MVSRHINDQSGWVDNLDPDMQAFLTGTGFVFLVGAAIVVALIVFMELRERANQRIFDAARGKLTIGLDHAGRQVRVEGEASPRIDRVWLKIKRSRAFRIDVEGGEPISVEALLDESSSHISIPSEIGEWHSIDDLIVPGTLRGIMSSDQALAKAELEAVYEQGIASPKLQLAGIQIIVRLELTCRAGTLDEAELVLDEHKNRKGWL